MLNSTYKLPILNPIRKILFLLNTDKSKLSLIALGFISVSMTEALGIGLVGPFLYLLNNPSEAISNPYSGWFYRQLNLSSTNTFVAIIGAAIILFFIIKSLANWKIQTQIFRFSYEQEARLTKKLLNAYLTAPYTYHLSKESSDIVHIVIADVKKLSLGVLVPLLTVLSNIAIITSISVLLLLSNPGVTLVALVLLLSILLALNSYKDKVKEWGAEISKSSAMKTQIVYQALGGIKEVKVIGCSDFFEHETDYQVERYVLASVRNFAFKIAPRMIMEIFFISAVVGFSSILLLFQGSAESIFSVLGVFALASFRLIPAFTNFANSVAVLRGSSYVINKLYLNLKELDEMSRSTHQSEKFSSSLAKGGSSKALMRLGEWKRLEEVSRLTFEKQICLKNVSYCYPNADYHALNNINLKVNKGESVAFIGKSGAGKSTLMDVLLGLLIPQKGALEVDGQSIYENLRAWQNLIGYIPQSIHLNNASVAENIAFGVPIEHIDYERLEKGIQAAQLEEVIATLPNGMNTEVGERGVRLSGGQRQRIGIARALYHGSQILIMDEATSALDSGTESLVTDAIKALSREKTIFVVAHRLSTIEHCDRVYLLEGGAIAKVGSYKDVVLQ